MIRWKKKNLKTEVSRKQIAPSFPKNEHFLPPFTYQPLVCFSGNLARFVFLLPPFWDSPFCLITNDLCVTCLLNHLCHFVSCFCILKNAIVHYMYIKALLLCCSALMIAIAKRSDIAKALIKSCSNKTLFNQQNVKGQVSLSYFMIFYECVINVFMVLVPSKVVCSHRNFSVALSCEVA